MNWRPPDTKVAVIRRYLMTSFPGTDISDGTDFDTLSQFFTVRAPHAATYRGAVSREVFDDFSDGQIDRLLRTHDLADEMRTAAPRRVTLTTTGCRIV